MKRISNKNARNLVSRRVPFNGSNLYARWMTNRDETAFVYVVFSYGRHFPIYAYTERSGRWFRNTDKYSVSTSRHQSQAMPFNVEFTDWDTQGMQTLIRPLTETTIRTIATYNR